MKAIVMAGGRGTRLLPYSALLPKPLMPLGDMPILELLLRQLRKAGITDVFLAVNHLSHLIQAYFGDGTRFGVHINYSLENQPLGTAGPMAAVLDNLGPDFVLTNGDLLTTLDISRMIQAHASSKPSATVGVFEREVVSDFGVVETDEAMRLTRYLEKPKQKHLVSMGIYVLNRDGVRDFVRPGETLDMPVLLQLLVEAGRAVRCYREDCLWLDIGRPDDFAQAQQLFEKDRKQFLGDL